MRSESAPRPHDLPSRRSFLGAASAACASACLPPWGEPAGERPALPATDFHVHLDGSTIDKVLELSRERGVKFGIVEHAGTRENKYPVVLSTDEELLRHIAMLEGKPVYKGVQAEWTDWMGCFSPAALVRLDYVLSDAMTFPGKDGRRMKLWEEGAEIGEPQSFMDRYVDWHVEILEKEPLDILANVSWLPAPLAAEHDRYWTPPRMKKVIEAAVRNGVAIEISSSFRLPRIPFLRMAKSSGARFSFGSNGRHPNMGKLEYSLQMAKELGLTAADLFSPAGTGKKAVERRKWEGKAGR